MLNGCLLNFSAITRRAAIGPDRDRNRFLPTRWVRLRFGSERKDGFRLTTRQCCLPLAKAPCAAQACRQLESGDVPSEVVESASPVLTLLVHGRGWFSIKRLMDDDARLGLGELDTHMAVVLRPTLDHPHWLEPGLGRGEVEARAVLPGRNAELEQTADLQIVRRPDGAPVLGCIPPYDIGRVVEGPPDDLDPASMSTSS